jgi:hypothetical protein
MTEWKERRRLAKRDDCSGGPQWYSRGYLPHFDEANLTQTLTFRLFDSMPQAVLDLWREELRLLPEREANRERRERIDAYLDRGYGNCYLRDDRLAEIVQNALLHFDDKRDTVCMLGLLCRTTYTLCTQPNRAGS